MFLFSNLLLGQLPDAVGVMAFGMVMIGASIVLRKLVGEKVPGDQSKTVAEERV